MGVKVWAGIKGGLRSNALDVIVREVGGHANLFFLNALMVHYNTKIITSKKDWILGDYFFVKTCA